MSLASEAAAGPPERAHWQRRKVDIWLDTRPEDDRAAAVAVLADPNWKHADVGALLRRHGCDVSDAQVARYRRDRHGFSH